MACLFLAMMGVVRGFDLSVVVVEATVYGVAADGFQRSPKHFERIALPD
jgi:hypothetical protein